MSSRAEPSGAVRLVVAHAGEARPLIDHFGLQKLPGEAPARVYARDRLSLVVSGAGKVAAGIAVAHLEGLRRDCGAWLNVGVAGHRTYPIGSTHLVHKVVDQATGQRWYPQRTFAAPCTTAGLVTVERPETAYRAEALYDMEAAGFCAACARYSTFELVQLVKVVSDNADNPITSFEPRRAGNLIGDALGVVERVIAELSQLCAEVAALRAQPPAWAAFIERWHWTATQRVQLKRLLQRWSMLRRDVQAIEVARDGRDSREALARLRAALDGAHPDFGVTTRTAAREIGGESALEGVHSEVVRPGMAHSAIRVTAGRGGSRGNGTRGQDDA